ncbi:MAG: SGNH/GDSL hydrolase family protein [Candidatus Pristimantibacillus sp.]
MWKQFVAIGDSLTQGIGDEVDGIALKSWVDHFAELHKPALKFTNLAKRGLISKEIREQQLEQALALQPDLVSLIAGANDILKGRWNRNEYKNDMTSMVDALSKSGATIILGSQADFTIRLPFPLEQKQAIKEQLVEANEIVQSLSRQYNLYYIDFWNHPLAQDAAIWSKDLVHPNSRGYQKIAEMIFDRVAASTTE